MQAQAAIVQTAGVERLGGGRLDGAVVLRRQQLHPCPAAVGPHPGPPLLDVGEAHGVSQRRGLDRAQPDRRQLGVQPCRIAHQLKRRRPVWRFRRVALGQELHQQIAEPAVVEVLQERDQPQTPSVGDVVGPVLQGCRGIIGEEQHQAGQHRVERAQVGR